MPIYRLDMLRGEGFVVVISFLLALSFSTRMSTHDKTPSYDLFLGPCVRYRV